jgi:hypothetical protein
LPHDTNRRRAAVTRFLACANEPGENVALKRNPIEFRVDFWKLRKRWR